MSVTVVVSFPISPPSPSVSFLSFPLCISPSFFVSPPHLDILLSFLPFPSRLSPCVPPSRCCSIFKRACSAQVILAAAGEGSDKSLMVEKRVCGTSGTRRQYQLTCRKEERWRKEETGWDVRQGGRMEESAKKRGSGGGKGGKMKN